MSVLCSAIFIVTVEDDQGALEYERFVLRLTFSVDANMDDRAAARIPSLDTISGSINGLNVFFQVAQNQATQPEAAAEPSKEGGPVRLFATTFFSTEFFRAEAD